MEMCFGGKGRGSEQAALGLRSAVLSARRGRYRKGWAGPQGEGGRGLRPEEEAGWGRLAAAAPPRSGTVLKVNSSASEGMTGSGVLPSPPKNVCLLLHTPGGSGPRTLFCVFG